MPTSHPKKSQLVCGSRSLDLSTTQVMGILNVTPDSFSDGGRFVRLDDALRQADAMFRAGAALIDVGGESTRPGATPVSTAEELERVAPVVDAIAQRLDVVISVDTSNPDVMTEAARLGAGLINDVRALRQEGALAAAHATGLPVCLMHMKGSPEEMQRAPDYEDVLGSVRFFLQEQRKRCLDVGISAERILLDPGFGFGKTLTHNLTLFAQLEKLHDLGQPLLVGVSRKSMIGQVLQNSPHERLAGSLALAALAAQNRVQILRVHDVAETVDVVRMVKAVQSYTEN